MNCRRCNTPIPSRSSSCPNCGQHVGHGESFIDDPGESGVLESPDGAEGTLSPSMLADPNVDPDDVDVEIDLEDEAELSLDDAVVPEDPAADSYANASSQSAVEPAPTRSKRKASAGAARARRGTASRSATKPGREAAVKPARKPAPELPDPTPSTRSGAAPEEAAMLPDAETVRAILAQQPELIEPGLEVLVDDGGSEIGVRHATDVGVIDLLARDGSGALVAVMVVGPEHEGDIVAEALHRLGWVRKHLAKSGEDVRGVVLTDHLDEQVAYAAAAVAGTVSFKSYALSLSLVDIDV